jgi:hypothetical protein
LPRWNPPGAMPWCIRSAAEARGKDEQKEQEEPLAERQTVTRESLALAQVLDA